MGIAQLLLHIPKVWNSCTVGWSLLVCTRMPQAAAMEIAPVHCTQTLHHPMPDISLPERMVAHGFFIQGPQRAGLAALASRALPIGTLHGARKSTVSSLICPTGTQHHNLSSHVTTTRHT
ncbi:hypothetical protein GGI42DRAFT_323979 [Trichoderma sp. SZMC 28013]